MTSSSVRVRKVALITGAAGIIGPGICTALQEAGWLVVAADYSIDSFERHSRIHGAPFPADLLLQGDLTVEAECRKLVDDVVARFGRLDLLVNGATAGSSHHPVFEIPLAELERTLKIDLVAPIIMLQAAAEALSQTGGSIINFSSVMTRIAPEGRIGYIAAKTAIEGITETLAYELSGQNIRINTIRVGSVAGDAFLRNALALLPPELAQQLYAEVMPQHYKNSHGSTLVGGIGTPSHIGEMIVYLSSPAGEYINAAILPVDGAFSLVMMRRLRKPETVVPASLIQHWGRDPEGAVRAWLKEKGIEHEI